MVGCAHAVGPGPRGTPSRGRSRRNRRRKPSCSSRRRWAEEAGSAGRSRRSLCRRCTLRTRRRAVVAEGVGGVETRPLARPPKGTQKKSLDAAVACDDGGVERRQFRVHGSLPAAWRDSGVAAAARWPWCLRERACRLWRASVRPRPAGARVRGAICCVFIGRTIGRAHRKACSKNACSRNPLLQKPKTRGAENG
jgi:hypothetical protein